MWLKFLVTWDKPTVAPLNVPEVMSLVWCKGKVHTLSIFLPGSQQQLITTLLPRQPNAAFHVNVYGKASLSARILSQKHSMEAAAEMSKFSGNLGAIIYSKSNHTIPLKDCVHGDCFIDWLRVLSLPVVSKMKPSLSLQPSEVLVTYVNMIYVIAFCFQELSIWIFQAVTSYVCYFPVPMTDRQQLMEEGGSAWGPGLKGQPIMAGSTCGFASCSWRMRDDC